jgi:hypothetical protein
MPIDEKPSRNEDEYFLKLDTELLTAQRARLDAERAEMERRQRELEREQHYMRCPKCGAQLAEQEVQHIKVDVCPQCNGTWLDAGELDLLRQTGRQGLGRLFDLLGHRAK